MNGIPKEELVEIITREVMSILNTGQEGSGGVSGKSGSLPAKPGALVLGPATKLPPEVSAGFDIYGVDDYVLHGDIHKYCCVYITEISLAQLSDIALGRDERPYQCAISKAILSGKTVYLSAEALAYRQFASTANKAYYDMLTGYEQKIIGFGVSVISVAKPADAVTTGRKDQNDQRQQAFDCTDKVVTGKKAEELCDKLKGVVNLPQGTILTPLAKDAFGAAKIKLNFV